jgi:oligoendopeptidase F
MSSSIPTRAEIPDSDKWDLTHLFADVSKWQEDFAWLQREYPKLGQFKGRVGESAETLAEVVGFEKALEQKMERVYHYASLRPKTAPTTNTSRGSARYKIYIHGSARPRLLLFRKFWRSTMTSSERSFPIQR